MKLDVFLKHCLAYFFKGVLFMVPLALTMYVFYAVLAKVDHLFVNIPIPGVGVICTIVLMIFVGFLASNIVTKKYFSSVDTLFARLPVVKLMYSPVKDFVEAFVGKEKKFNRPALITLFPEQGIKILGFVTSEGIESLGIPKDEIVVFVPQSYNFAGQMWIVPRSSVQFLDINSSTAMSIIISAAVANNKLKV